jgi:hypothetical protein
MTKRPHFRLNRRPSIDAEGSYVEFVRSEVLGDGEGVA